MRARINTAYETLGPAGPIVSAAGMATQPLTYLGVGPVSRAVGGVAGGAAERYLPVAAAKLAAPAAEGATAAEIASAAHTAGQGGSPSDYLLNAATAIPTGALIGGGASALPLGRSTPAEATSATAQAAQAAELAKAGITIPRKNLGFTVSAGPGEWDGDPTLGQVNELKDFLTKQQPGQGQDILLNKIDAQTSSPAIQQADAAAQAAAKQADWAKTLERWGSNAGLPGAAGAAGAAAPGALGMRSLKSTSPPGAAGGAPGAGAAGTIGAAGFGFLLSGRISEKSTGMISLPGSHPALADSPSACTAG